MPETPSRQRASRKAAAAAASDLQPLPVPASGANDAEMIAVAGVDAGAAIDVLASCAQGPDAESAVTVLKGLAKQISAVLASLNPPAPTPSAAPALSRP